VLEYFDASLIGLTATPAPQTIAYFHQNRVAEYNHERAVADGVNVGYDVYRIKTRVSVRGSTVPSRCRMSPLRSTPPFARTSPSFLIPTCAAAAGWLPPPRGREAWKQWMVGAPSTFTRQSFGPFGCVCSGSPGQRQNPETSVSHATGPRRLTAICRGSLIRQYLATAKSAVPKCVFPCHLPAMAGAANHSAPAARRTAPLAIWSVMILLVLYVLSPGPVVKMRWGKSPALAIIYAPLNYLHDHSRAVRDFYKWDFRLWGV
jgi:hypothetical protein